MTAQNPGEDLSNKKLSKISEQLLALQLCGSKVGMTAVFQLGESETEKRLASQ